MKIIVTRPEKLTGEQVFRLSALYHTQAKDFVAITDGKCETMYVNAAVPQKDREEFLNVATFPEYWVADEEEGEGQFLEYAYKKYGYGLCCVLMDAHKQYMGQKERRRAKETAKVLIPLIEKELGSESPAVEYDEFLASEIWRHGNSLGKTTQNNITGYGSVYLFYLGYLMGAGMLGDGGGIQGKGSP